MNSKERFGTILKIRGGLGSWPNGVTVEQEDLSPDVISQVMTDLGKDLAQLHVKEGTGYGPVNPTKLLLLGQFTAPYESWSDYLMERLKNQGEHLTKIVQEEAKSGRYISTLSFEQREQMQDIIEKRPFITAILKNHLPILLDVQSHLLHGNIHQGIIFTDHGRYSGLADFSQMVLGDPVDDLAYASIMPHGEEWKKDIIKGWRDVTDDPDLEEKMHLYRLLESYRKIYTRYVKHHWLGTYFQPLEIAQQELDYYGA